MTFSVLFSNYLTSCYWLTRNQSKLERFGSFKNRTCPLFRSPWYVLIFSTYGGEHSIVKVNNTYCLHLRCKFDSLNLLQAQLPVRASDNSRVGRQILIRSHLRRRTTSHRHRQRSCDLRQLLLLLRYGGEEIWRLIFCSCQIWDGASATGVGQIRILRWGYASH